MKKYTQIIQNLNDLWVEAFLPHGTRLNPFLANMFTAALKAAYNKGYLHGMKHTKKSVISGVRAGFKALADKSK